LGVKASVEPAPELSVAQVMVDSPLPHLDRPFDYLVTADQHDRVAPGVRVRVRFAGTDIGGMLIGRSQGTDHVGRLTPISRVVSPVCVLTDETSALVRAVADRYAGTFGDVLRAAVPPRHARVEAEFTSSSGSAEPPLRDLLHVDPAGWSRYAGGEALLTRLASQQLEQRPRAVVTLLPDDDGPERIAELVAATHNGGRGSLVLVPDARDVARYAPVLEQVVTADRLAVLTADLGPAARYRSFMRVLSGTASVVLGTRAAAFAPVSALGLAVIVDDGDDLYADPHAPYWHAREVLALRGQHTGCSVVLAAHSRSVEAAQALHTGWAREVAAARATIRQAAPRVTGTDDEDQARDAAARSARIPHRAFVAARAALEHGPVLIQVPRRGYAPALACQGCRTLARCTHCAGPLESTSGHAVAQCRWCGQLAGAYQCGECGGRTLRAITVGAARTAEELGRAFAGVPVITSGRDRVLDSVGQEPALVVSTPGAEPHATGRYAAAILLDARSMLERPDLRAQEEALRRWINAAVLVRPSSDGGQVIVVAESSLPAVQTLVRWDPGSLAERERVERAALRLPPPWRVAELAGTPRDVADFISLLELPDSARVLGPVPMPVTNSARSRSGASNQVRALVSASHEQGAALAAACKSVAAVRSAAKSGEPVMVRLDPVALG